MKDIDELIQNTEKYAHALVQKRFESKKHTVSYVLLDNQPRILKWYAPGFRTNMETEYQILQKGSSKLTIPSLLEKDTEHNVLIMGYIFGNNLGDIIDDEQIPYAEKQTILHTLSTWFAQFHNFFKDETSFRIRGDPSVRNFLFKEKIWGVDFEESRKGNPSEDVAGFCASILTLDPMFTAEKIRLCKAFIESYIQSVEWKLETLNDDIAYALMEKIPWRPDQEKILRQYAQHIGKKGL
ncbi:MAG: hypothetical protein V1726_01150 [Methanobacteriota archaeon]